MFTQVSTSFLAQTDQIVEIKYDFITAEDKIAFSMGDINLSEKTIEEFIKEGNKED